MRLTQSIVSQWVVAAVLLAPSTRAASACDDGSGGTARDRAKAHYEAGVAAYHDKHYSEAIDHLSCANQLLDSPAFAYNIAVTYEAMGDVATALRWYREHRRKAGAEANSDASNAKVAELEAKLQRRGVQQVSVLSKPEGAMLSIDDRALGLTPLTLELNPGHHSYRLTLAGHTHAEGSFELRVDRSLDVEAELRPVATPTSQPALTPIVSASSDVRVSTPAEPAPSFAPWTWISLGTGTLLLGGALGFEWRRAQLDADLGSASQADYQRRYDAMTTQQTTARLLAGLGAAALVSGGVLWIIDLNREPGSDVALGACAEDVWCVAGRGAF